MVTIKLKELAQKLNKSISDIALETKLNRNTVTALYHNKVDGIKFDTIEKICQTYQIKLSDLIDFEIETKQKREAQEIYKQEGSIVPFTCLPWQLAANNLNPQNFNLGFGQQWTYFAQGNGSAYWEKNKMYDLAESVYNENSSQERIDRLFNIYNKEAEALKTIYYQASANDILNLTENELIDYFNKLNSAYARFWANSLFIDSFDAGFDVEKINQIAKQYQFSVKEIETLTTSPYKTFNKERELALLKIVKKIKAKKNTVLKSDNFLKDYVKNSPEIKQYILDFDYYKSNYTDIEHITDKEIIAELKKYVQNKDLGQAEYELLENYEVKHNQEVKAILKKYKLRENPLYFFSLLTYWRENRKQINLMGIHVLEMILGNIEKTTGIPKIYLKYLLYDELENIFKGTVDLEILKRRQKEGCMIYVQGKDYHLLVGDQALSLKNELENNITIQTAKDVIYGQVACQGYAKGVAKIILTPDDFAKLKEGEILVTSMTRPEYVPLMKKAGGIVTNEGGITCHAAIVSRELGKPCIIGTGNATQLIKDGDLIEVRANHGTVRILS